MPSFDRFDCLEGLRVNSRYEVEGNILYEPGENEFYLSAIAENDTKTLPLKTEKSEADAFAKMENLFFSDLNGPFDVDDFFLDDPILIDDTALPVHNVEISESNLTAQEVLEETILSPAAKSNWGNATDEVGQFFPETFINLAAMESNVNSFSTDPMSTYLAPDIPIDFDDLLANANEKIAYENAPIYNVFADNVNMEPQVHNVVPIDTPDSTAVVPNIVPEITPEMSPNVPNCPVDVTDSGIFANNFSLDLNQLDPAILALLNNLNNSVESDATVPQDNRKRALEDEEHSTEPATKKRKPSSTSSSNEEAVPDKIVKRRIKNNAASRVCRASRKARHDELFQKEKDLTEENKELAIKVEKLSATVEYLRSYVVEKLSGRVSGQVI